MKPPTPKYIISACLAGINCTYRGSNKFHPSISKLYKKGLGIAVCPEVMGGLSTPRENSEIADGDGYSVLLGRSKAISSSGKDLTEKYICGSLAILDLANRFGIKKAILKSKSPACGFGSIYDGTFKNNLKPGSGVLAALLSKKGLKISTEKTAGTVFKNL